MFLFFVKFLVSTLLVQICVVLLWNQLPKFCEKQDFGKYYSSTDLWSDLFYVFRLIITYLSFSICKMIRQKKDSTFLYFYDLK